MANKSGSLLKNLLGTVPTGSDSTSVSGTGNGITTSPISQKTSAFNTVFIYGGSIDNTVIGQNTPADGYFTSITINKPIVGGNFIVYGKNSPVDYMKWDPFNASLNVQGALNVRDPTTLGNIQIFGNTIQAVNTDGDVLLSPNDSNAKIGLGGNIIQTAAGIVSFNEASSFLVGSSSTINLNSVSGTTVSATAGSITLSATSVICNSPIQFGSGLNVPTISYNSTDVILSANNVLLIDPIPMVQCQSGQFSDSGIAVAYSSNGLKKIGFFGFKDSTENFTYIPDAQITLNTDGTKTVVGSKGILDVSSVNLSNIKGDPDINLISNNIYIPENSIFSFGISGSISGSGGSVVLEATNKISLNSAIIDIPLGTSLSFDGGIGSVAIVAPVSGTLELVSVDTLNLNTSEINLNVSSTGFVNIPNGGVLSIGDGQSIFRNSSGATVIESSGLINLQSGSAISIPVQIPLNFGEIGSFISGGGVGVGITILSSGQLQLTSVGNTVISPFSGYCDIKSLVTRFIGSGNGAANLWFGTSNGQSSLSFDITGTLSLNNLGNVNISSQNASINLNSSQEINIPLITPLIFGNLGRIWQDETDFHISSTQNIIVSATNVTFNGSVVVNGPSQYITSTITGYNDPIISLAINSPSGDIKDRGVEFLWFDGGYSKMGFMGFNQQFQRFELISDGINNNDIYSGYSLTSPYGDLIVGNLTALSVSTSNFTIGEIIGNPNLILSCPGGTLFLQPSSSVNISLNVPIVSGNNSIVASQNSWSITSPNVFITGGAVSIGTVIMNTINNDFHISGIGNVYIDANLYTEQLLIGTSAVSFDGSSGNLMLQSVSNIVLESFTVLDAGFKIGNSESIWDSNNAQLLWKSTILNTPLTVNLLGIITSATWNGNPIEIDFGGTGHSGTWTSGSVVFVGNSGVSLVEDNNNFYYNSNTKCLGLLSNTPRSTLTLGSGNIELGNDGNVIWRAPSTNGNGYLWSIGNNTEGQFIISTTVNTLQSVVAINSIGQVGIGIICDNFINNSSSLLINNGLYVASGGVVFGQNQTEFITFQNGILSLNAETVIEFESNVSIADTLFFQSLTSGLSINSPNENVLEIASSKNIIFSSQHAIFEGRSCYWHDQLDNCQSYIVQNLPNLEIHNLLGNISLFGESISIADNISLIFGPGNSITANGQNLLIQSSGTVDILSNLNMKTGTKLSFGTVGSGIGYNSTSNAIEWDLAQLDLKFVTIGNVVLPDQVNLQFGDPDRSIYSNGKDLVIMGNNALTLQASDINIIGNINVTGSSSFIAATETHFDNGVLTLGAGQILSIVSVGIGTIVGSVNTTIVTVGINHGLVVGDTVNLVDTIPSIDGTYTVLSLPTLESFEIPVTFPGVMAGITVSGTVYTPPVINTGIDLGLQFDFFDGVSGQGTLGSKMGFFGFSRATERLKYFSNSTKNAGVYSGTLGDLEIGNLFLSGTLSCIGGLSNNLNCSAYAVQGSNFIITGGSIDGTVVGSTNPQNGTFQSVTINGTLSVTQQSLVSNLNCEYLNGHPPSDFILRDGSQSLTGNWNAGAYRITSSGLSDTTLSYVNSIVYSGTGGVLTSSSSFLFNSTSSTLFVNNISAVKFVGNVDLGGHVLVNSYIQNSSITLSSKNSFDGSLGNVTFANGQLFGGWISGGTANMSITGNCGTVTNGLYTTNYSYNNSILKADSGGNPVNLQIPEGTLIGREVGGVITALSPSQVLTLLGITSDEGTVTEPGAITTTGGTLTGNLYRSYERIVVSSSGDVGVVSVNNEISYVQITYSSLSAMASLTLDHGLSDGHLKVVIVEQLPIGCSALLSLALTSPWDSGVESAPPVGVLFEHQANTVQLVWSASLQSWYLGDSGARAVTADYLSGMGNVPPIGSDNNVSPPVNIFDTRIERFSVATSQTMNVDPTKVTSFISVTYPTGSTSNMSQCNLSDGIVDGQRKTIILSNMAENAKMLLTCSLTSVFDKDVEISTPVALMFELTGQSAQLEWDAVQSKWYITDSGCKTVTAEELIGQGNVAPSGNTNIPDSNFFLSRMERISMNVSQTVNADPSKETSYISVVESPGFVTGTVNLGNGTYDGQQKLIVMSAMDGGTQIVLISSLQLVYSANQPSPPAAVLFTNKGQSCVLQWDDVMKSWIALNNSFTELTALQLQSLTY